MLPAAYTWSLTAAALGTAVAVLWVMRRFSRQDRIALAKRKMRAYFYGMRVYAGEPALVLRAQARLLLWTARYLALMLRPAAVIAVPAAVLFVPLGNIYGRRPLLPGESAIITVQFTDASGALTPTLEGRGIAVETPAVRLSARRQACWRVRAVDAASGSVQLRLPGETMALSVACGRGMHYLPGQTWFWPFRARAVRWITVAYPPARLAVFGIAVDWRIWFLAVSLLGMLALRKRFNVVL